MYCSRPSPAMSQPSLRVCGIRRSASVRVRARWYAKSLLVTLCDDWIQIALKAAIFNLKDSCSPSIEFLKTNVGIYPECLRAIEKSVSNLVQDAAERELTVLEFVESAIDTFWTEFDPIDASHGLLARQRKCAGEIGRAEAFRVSLNTSMPGIQQLPQQTNSSPECAG